MDFKYDATAKALYFILVQSSKVFKTKEYADGAILVDISSTGDIIGIEFLDLNVDQKYVEQISKEFKNPQIAKIKPAKILAAIQ